ncbi:MAG: hypothetical protein SFW67_18635 [Myxococcaceae bacterium]|nr:hypothetical protein [Myxococcaceae bacterium]
MPSSLRPHVLLTSLTLLACSPAWQAARRGQEALDRGDPVTALAEYAAACKQSNDQDWCERTERLYLDVKADLVKQARPLCGVRGKERACLDLVNQARRVKDDPELASLADAAGATWLAACRVIETPTPVDAIVRVRCISALASDVGTPAYQQQAAAERLEAARFVGIKAKEAQAAGLIGSALGLGTLAICFSREAPAPVPVVALRALTAERFSVPTAVAADGLLSRELVCSDLSRQSDGRLRCETTNTLVGLRASVFRGELTHTFSDEPMSKEYVVRRDVYDNPEWFRLSRLRESHLAAVRQARQNERLAEDDCRQAQSELSRAGYCQRCSERTTEESYCRRARTMEDFRRDTERDLERVDQALRQTDRQLVNEVRDVYHWVRRTHVWRLPYSVTLAAAGGAPSKDFVLTMKRTDEEQQGFPPANVPTLVAVPPEVSRFDENAVADAREELGRWATEAQEALSRQQEARCAQRDTPGQVLECQTAAAFIRGVDPGVDYVARLGKAADTRGTYPPAACAP